MNRGFGAQVDRDLAEWDYGAYERRLTNNVLADHPGWQLFRGGCPGRESSQQVAPRADGVVARVRAEARGMFCFFPMVIFSACWSHTGLVSKPSTPDRSCWAQPA
jgi:broad specificity phosphatase PhoE